MTAAVICRACGAQPRAEARFCDACGAQIEAPTAEYKQVTVLFADVVRSMDLASTVDAERLREIMAELFDRSAAIVQRYGGTVDKFTGDGIMAVFGAPTTLEDHALRACLASLDIQHDVGATLQLRIGLNSGQVIAGEIGSGKAGYTAIGQQVGMAQRMESVAPPGGVMLSESTARLVEQAVVLGDLEMVQIKGSEEPAPARRLLAISEHRPSRRTESALVGRSWELNTIAAILDEAMLGAGCVVTVVGPPGIGKSRLIREATAIADVRGVEVVGTYCESHAHDVPFHALARLLRSGMGITDLNAADARSRVREQRGDADPEDLEILDDLLGIRDPTAPLPDIAPDARRRRLTALVNSAALAGPDPTVYVIEDVHWIDDASESLLADFLAVVPQIPVLTLITYRPEYRGPLSQMPGAQTIALRPLSEAQATTLTAQLLGADPPLYDLAGRVAERAGGNPFFAEEMVRDLAERGVIDGDPGSYTLRGDIESVDVPATLHATIGARIDRLDGVAKRTLNAAALIGSRFDADLLSSLVDEPDVVPLIAAELVDQVTFGPVPQYAFRHPLIRAVANDSQLKSDRAQLHRRLASIIEDRDPGSADANAALIAEHFEAAGDLHSAFEWHMRAASWVNHRDNKAVASSWRRAQQVADRLPDDDQDRLRMRIAPRTMLCATGFRLIGRGFASGFDELRDLCLAADDLRSLAVAMSGPVMELSFDARRREASRLADEQVRLLESIDDPDLTLALINAAISVKYETAEVCELLRLAERAIGLAGGDAKKGGRLATSSPLSMAFAFRSLARWCLGITGWKGDAEKAVQMANTAEPVTRAGAMYYAYSVPILNAVLQTSEAAVHETIETFSQAEQSGEDVALGLAQSNLAIALVCRGTDSRAEGLERIAQVRELALQERHSRTALPLLDAIIARDRVQQGELDGAIELSRSVIREEIDGGGAMWIPMATNHFVEALSQRDAEGDIAEAQAAIDQLAALPTDPGYVLNEIWLLRMRALLARAQGDDARYRDYRDRYRETATYLGFEGHMAMADEMP
ncbi:adenylate/guanylate cyclase domain-containing protein [Mycobacterium sp. 2YAF39]|uniref:ATP-binding protein n=1 Tax=Mycobacterium sp. 2YAF39 TaxID=3233033 RepID=UPI003F95992D